MITQVIILICFGLYGGIAIYDFIDIYKNNGIFLNDDKCDEIYYYNIINCILGWFLSIYIIGFLLCKYLCRQIIEVKLNFTLSKCITILVFIGINIINTIELYEDESCYIKYKIKYYTISYICLVVIMLCTLVINSLFCSNDDNNYEPMNYK